MGAGVKTPSILIYSPDLWCISWYVLIQMQISKYMLKVKFLQVYLTVFSLPKTSPS